MTQSEKRNVGILAEKLNVEKKELLEQALTHPDNRRIAWLGDAILRLAVTEHLYRSNPTAPRSELEPERGKIVDNEYLKETAGEQLYREGHIRVPPWERDPHAKRILATAYEAVTGVIFLEKGYEAAAEHVRRTLPMTTIQHTSPECPSS